MTVNSNVVTAGPYTGNGSTTIFSFFFRADRDTEVGVYKTSNSGVVTKLVLTTNYTVSGLGNSAGGSVVLNNPLPAGEQIYIRSERQLLQPISFPSQGPFLARVHELAFDQIVYLIQQIAESQRRTVRLLDNDIFGTLSALPPVAQRAGKVLIFDENGDISVASVGSINPDPDPGVDYTVETLAQLFAALDASTGGETIYLDTTTFEQVTLSGYSFTTPVTIIPTSSTTITLASLIAGCCFELVECSNIIVQGVELIGGLRGFCATNCNNVTARGVVAHGQGTRGIVYENTVDGAFTGWKAIECQVYDTGNSNAALGQGILMGNTINLTYGPVTDVLLDDNTVENTTAAGIKILPNVTDLEMLDNSLDGIDIASGGAYEIGIEVATHRDATLSAHNNSSVNVTCRTAATPFAHFAVGMGNIEVFENNFNGNAGAYEYGISAYKTSGNQTFNNLTTYDNLFGSIVSEQRVRMNLDGAASSNMNLIIGQYGPIAHYKATDAASITAVSGAVSQWKNTVKDYYHLTASGSARPSTGTRTVSTRNVIDFNGTSHFMSIANGPQLLKDSMVFIVGELDDATTAQRILSFQDSTNALIGAGIASSKLFFLHNTSFTPAGVTPATGKFLLAGYKNGSAQYAAAQGATNTVGGTNTSINNLDGWFLGSVGAGVSTFFNGAIGEIILYDYYDDATFASVIATLTSEWAITNPAPDPEPTPDGYPVLSRSHTANATFVNPGSNAVFTYVSDRDCYWQELYCPDNTTTAVSANGRTFTITIPIAADAPGDSHHVGVQAWTYVNDTTEAVTELSDLYHVGKSPSDIINIGVGTIYPVLQTAIEQSGVAAGATYVIKPGTYSDVNDTLMVGWYGTGTNLNTPNGVSTTTQTVDVYNGAGSAVTGTETIKVVTKFTTIISESPLDAILDRGYQNRSMRLLGNYRNGANSGLREVFGINIKGIALRNCVDGPDISRADACSMTMFSVVNDANPADYSAANGGATGFYMDGGAGAMGSVRNCVMEHFNLIGNNRFGINIGRYGVDTVDASKHYAVRKGFITNACTISNNERHTQALTGYGSRHSHWLNVISIDSALFKDGVRNNISGNLPPYTDAAFIGTNNAMDDCKGRGLVSFRDLRSGFRSDRNGATLKNDFNDCVAWWKVEKFNEAAMLTGDSCNYNRMTVGRNMKLDTSYGAGSVCYDVVNMKITNLLAVHPHWDAVYPATDKIMGGYASAGEDSNLTFIPTGDTIASSYSAIATNIAYASITDGAKYAMRLEPGSTLYSSGRGCKDAFVSWGKTGSLMLSEDPTVQTNINWMTRSPWRKYRRERATYSCLANGTTYVGNVGGFADNMNPIDYLMSWGTSPATERVTPTIESIKVHLNASGNPVVTWRPLATGFRSTIVDYDLWIDGVQHTTGIAKSVFSRIVTGLSSGSHDFQIEVNDSVTGASGLSRKATITV